MSLEALSEYVKDKAWLIGIVLTLVGIILTLTAAIGLLWISAAVALGFMITWPIRQANKNWHLFSGRARYVQTGLNVVVLAMLAWVLLTGLITYGPVETFKNWGLMGIDVIVLSASSFCNAKSRNGREAARSARTVSTQPR